jgi:hypothetical protein
VSTSTKPKVAEYRWEGTNNNDDSVLYEKYIAVEYDENTDELTITFRASQKVDGSFSNDPGAYDRWPNVDWTKHDEKTFNWDRFLELMSAIEGGADDEGGREFVRSVFVGGHSGPAAVGNQGVITGENPTIAQPESRPDENGDFLHVYYQTEDEDDPKMLNIRWVQAKKDGTRPDEGKAAGGHYHWELQDHELQQLLVEDPDIDPDTDRHIEAAKGFTREFRKALFLNPRRHRMIEML